MRTMSRALILGSMLVGPAGAHDDAVWIEANPAYRDRFGIKCCGETDCAVVQPGEIVRADDGWQHVPTRSVLRDGDKGIYPSTDAQTWRCARQGRLTCLFLSTGF